LFRLPSAGPNHSKCVTNMGAGGSTAANALSPGWKKRAKKNRRQVLKDDTQDLNMMLMQRFDANNSGALCRAEVKAFMETICDEVAPGLGKCCIFKDSHLELCVLMRGTYVVAPPQHARHVDPRISPDHVVSSRALQAASRKTTCP